MAERWRRTIQHFCGGIQHHGRSKAVTVAGLLSDWCDGTRGFPLLAELGSTATVDLIAIASSE
jgi:hypothetical protein